MSNVSITKSKFASPNLGEGKAVLMAEVLAILASKGFTPIAPKILWPAEHLVDVFGEELKKRLFLTTNLDGVEYALRPDFTVPVALSFMETGLKQAQYSYCGTVFRQRDDGQSGEFIQTGVEDFGATDFAAKDAEILALAIELCASQINIRSSSLGPERSEGIDPRIQKNIKMDPRVDPRIKSEDEDEEFKLTIHLGDAGLFTAMLKAVQCPPHIAAKLKQDLGRLDKLTLDLRDQTINNLNDSELMCFTNDLVNFSKQDAIEILVDVFEGNIDISAVIASEAWRSRNKTGLPLPLGSKPEGPHNDGAINPIGNRTPADIVSRLQARKRGSDLVLSPEQIATIRRYIQIECPLNEALAVLQAYAKEFAITLPLDAFEARIKAFEQAGIETSTIQFSGSFGRRLNYYSGFMFNITLPHNTPDKPLAGGGRYDGLLTMLGHSEAVPAVGFALWNGRIGKTYT